MWTTTEGKKINTDISYFKYAAIPVISKCLTAEEYFKSYFWQEVVLIFHIILTNIFKWSMINQSRQMVTSLTYLKSSENKFFL